MPRLQLVVCVIYDAWENPDIYDGFQIQITTKMIAHKLYTTVNDVCKTVNASSIISSPHKEHAKYLD